MALSIVRFQQSNSTVSWGVLQQEKIFVLSIQAETTTELLQYGYQKLYEMAQQANLILDSRSVHFLTPIVKPSQILCQGANYRQHMIESGMNPDAKLFNMFFTKSVAAITDPVGEIIKPGHVQLLDYEIELALVLGKKTVGTVEVTQHNLHEYIAGICIANDISARDIQLPQMQFHKGKSYRTFCPLGPILCLLQPEEMSYLHQLDLILKVNGEIRQDDNTKHLVFKPAKTLSEYSEITDFEVGDVLLTGTPSGCALGLPAPALVRLSGLLPETLKWKAFIKAQAKRTQYLKSGDVIESRIISTDGKIDLGIQKHTVKHACAKLG